MYLNSGDWIENLTALEYHKARWKIYHYSEDTFMATRDIEEADPMEILEKNELFARLMQEFNGMANNKVSRHDEI